MNRITIYRLAFVMIAIAAVLILSTAVYINRLIRQNHELFSLLEGHDGIEISDIILIGKNGSSRIIDEESLRFLTTSMRNAKYEFNGPTRNMPNLTVDIKFGSAVSTRAMIKFEQLNGMTIGYYSLCNNNDVRYYWIDFMTPIPIPLKEAIRELSE